MNKDIENIIRDAVALDEQVYLIETIVPKNIFKEALALAMKIKKGPIKYTHSEIKFMNGSTIRILSKDFFENNRQIFNIKKDCLNNNPPKNTTYIRLS